MAVGLRLLGTPAIGHEGRWLEPPPGRVSALLYYLAFQGGWVDRGDLAFLFWPDHPEQSARSNLRKTLGRAREFPFTRQLEAERTRLRWRIDTDTDRLFRAAADRRWSTVIELYRGELLRGFAVANAQEFERWLEEAREQLRSSFRAAVMARSEELEAAKRFAEAAELLERLRKLDPFDEDLLRHQLHDFRQAGQRRRALVSFEQFRAYLQHEFAAEPEHATLALIEEIRADEAGTGTAVAVVPTVRGASSGPSHNLPLQPTEFVGRLLEQQRIAGLLADPSCRLITLVAPGGMGKTRLALAAGSANLERFPDGVFFVPLAASDTSEQMLYEVAGALGLGAPQQDVREKIVSHLATRTCLLILDNLEHLPGSGAVIADLLLAASGLKVIATSREQLHLRSEWLFELGGLGYPTNAASDDLASYDAVELFRRQAERIRPDFAPRNEQLQQVARICQLVAGMPLALELAAGWLRVLTSADIVAELERSIDLLETSAPDMPERHRSIRAVFDYSWQLLSASQQRALAALAIFRDGFDRTAARRVTGATTRVLLELVGKSLLQRSETGRFGMHPLIFQYAALRLAELPGLAAEMQANHGSYYLEHLQGLDRVLRQGRQKEALEAMDLDAANIYAMWRWAVAERKLSELEAVVGGLDKFFTQRNRYREGIELFEQSVADLEMSDPGHHRTIGRISGVIAWLHVRLGEYDRGWHHAERALELLQPLAAGDALTEAYNVVGAINGIWGRYPEAKFAFEQALGLARSQGDSRYVAYYQNNLAITEKELGNYGEAERLYREALEQGRRLGEQVSVVRNLNNLGLLLRAMGRLDDARTTVREGLEMARSMGFEQTLPHLLGSLGGIEFDSGALGEAHRLFSQALELVRASGTRGTETSMLAGLAMVETARGEHETAQRLFREALGIAVESKSDKAALSIVAELIELRARQGRPAEAGELLALVNGHPSSDSATRERARCIADRHPDLAETVAIPEGTELAPALRRVLAGL